MKDKGQTDIEIKADVAREAERGDTFQLQENSEIHELI